MDLNSLNAICHCGKTGQLIDVTIAHKEENGSMIMGTVPIWACECGNIFTRRHPTIQNLLDQKLVNKGLPTMLSSNLPAKEDTAEELLKKEVNAFKLR